MRNLIIVSCLTLTGVITCAKLPSTFKKCDRHKTNFNECLTEAIANVVPQLVVPFREIGLPGLEPLELPTLTIGAGTGAVGVQQNYKNVKLYGLTKARDLKVNFDLDNKIATLSAFIPEIKILSQYAVKGKILLLSVNGSGNSTIILDKLITSQTFYLEEFEKKGKKYFKVVKDKLTLEPGRLSLHFENLLGGGDKNLNENINQVINDNWQEVFQDIKANYEEAFGILMAGLFNKVLEKVPHSDIFG